MLRTIWLLTFVSLVVGLSAQTGNSPYSRLGIGDLVSNEFSHLRSLGGLSAAYSSPFQTNILNPASLGHLSTTSFEIGFDTRSSKYTFGNESQSFWDGGLTHMSLAFPIFNPLNRLLDRKKTDFNWGMSISLLPHSRVIHATEVSDVVPSVGEVTRQYEGSGGTNKISWGNGFKYKQLYFGLNVGYLFGTISNERAVLFEDLILQFHDYMADDHSYRGFFWNGGFQYVFDLSQGKALEDERQIKSLTIGLHGNSRWSYKTVSERFSALKSSVWGGLSDDIPDEETDTIFYADDIQNKGKMPSEFGIGITYQRGTKFLMGLNYRTSGWSNYENNVDVGNFDNSWQFSLGGEFVPDADSYRFYHRRIRYRAGLQFGTDPRVIEGEDQIKDLSINLGFGLPIILSRQLSFINLGVEYGQHGGQIPIKENFFRLHVGVSLNNNLWFYKRKFN
jgi:hypothetical protein